MKRKISASKTLDLGPTPDQRWYGPMDRTSIVLHHGIETIREALSEAAGPKEDKKAYRLLETAESALADLYQHLGNRWAKPLEDYQVKVGRKVRKKHKALMKKLADTDQ